ncbi:MAG: MraY family glycosyltransferase, partial [Gammaproteobacteria bacterium]
MDLHLIIDFLIISILASFAINMILRNVAKNNNLLVDLPDKSRKFHKRATPLTGGLAILIAALITGHIYVNFNDLRGFIPDFTYYLIISSIILVLVFLFDDMRGIKAFIRILFQSALALFMILTTEVYISNLGNIFGFGDIYLGAFGIPFTVFCVVGIMNAFNMIDGINGLCAGCAMTALLFIGFSSGLIYDSMLVLLIGAMIGFLFFNLRIVGKKRAVFLGDHGSNMIGFWVAWSAIYASQTEIYKIEPMTIIWFVAIPLLDCIGLIFSRRKRGISWTTPGRDHIHHKLMNRFSPEGTLIVIILICISLSSFALIIEKFGSSYSSFALFFIFSVIYYFFAYYYEHIS